MDALALLSPLTPQQRNEFGQFKEQWDEKCVEEYRETWGEVFLQKAQAVLDALEADKDAFSRFVFDEQLKVFKGRKCITVPPSKVVLPLKD